MTTCTSKEQETEAVWVTGQFAHKPLKPSLPSCGYSSRRLVNPQTRQIAKKFDLNFGVRLK